MISGGDEDSSEDDESSGAVSQWSLIARAPKVLGVDPVTQLQVHRYSYIFTSTFNSGTTYNSTQPSFILPSHTPSLPFSPHGSHFVSLPTLCPLGLLFGPCIE